MMTEAHAAYPDLSIRALCTAFGASRTWWYTHPTPDEIAARDTALRDAIERIVLEFPGYGYRRVTKALQREGWDINHKRVLRVMRDEALLFRTRLSDLSEPAGRSCAGSSQSGVGGGSDLHSLAHDLCLSGVRAGCLVAVLCRLGVVAHD
jgi:hypothetical protein